MIRNISYCKNVQIITVSLKDNYREYAQVKNMSILHIKTRVITVYP